MAGRTLGNAIPLAGPLFADVFTAHKWAARMIVWAIDQRIAGNTAAEVAISGAENLVTA